MKHCCLLATAGLILVTLGCGSKSDTPAGVDEAGIAIDIDPGEQLDQMSAKVAWKDENRSATVDLRDVPSAELLKAVAATVALPGVQEVQLEGHYVKDPAVLPVAGIPTLRRLRLTETAATDLVLEKLAQQAELQLLHLHGNPNLTAVGMDKLAAMKELKDVSLSGGGIDDSVIGALAALPKLKKLRLRGTAITGENFNAIQSSPAVDLELAETAFGNAGMPAVAAMPNLTKLNLWLTKVDDSGVKALAGKTQLTSLNLDNMPGVTDASIETILTLPNLTFLHLGKTKVTTDGVKQLVALEKLETLHVTNLQISDEDLAELQDQMPSLKNLVN